MYTSDMYSAWGCAFQHYASVLYYSHEARSRVGAHLSKLWPYMGNWAKSRGWAFFCEWALFSKTMLHVTNSALLKLVGCFNHRVVTLVEWLILVSVKTTREVVSLFPPFSLFQNEGSGGSNKETGCLTKCTIISPSSTKVNHATRVTTLQLQQPIYFYSVMYR